MSSATLEASPHISQSQFKHFYPKHGSEALDKVSPQDNAASQTEEDFNANYERMYPRPTGAVNATAPGA